MFEIMTGKINLCKIMASYLLKHFLMSLFVLEVDCYLYYNFS